MVQLQWRLMCLTTNLSVVVEDDCILFVQTGFDRGERTEVAVVSRNQRVRSINFGDAFVTATFVLNNETAIVIIATALPSYRQT